MHPFLAKVTSEELLAELERREVLGRAAQPWEVANVMVFLASDYASYLTGEQSMFSYLTTPFTRSFRRAFREE
jgi:NAD(P)-dependent dehydrogenase (short-subunit alcohol dehydrogenase family)